MKRLTRFVCSPVLAALLVLLMQQPGKAQGAAPDALTFFKNYFVTGGSRSGFVDLAPQSGSNGSVTGVIPMSGVPPNADLIAALLLLGDAHEPGGPGNGPGDVQRSRYQLDRETDWHTIVDCQLRPMLELGWRVGLDLRDDDEPRRCPAVPPDWE